ncbi:unnamed protein product [Owenia fusiformis]|uniref:Uncharacterized protein n=1 Tax=Owenia fusiformis TaxID=6347 RepID=A0A8J1USF6_OWEFU|nr:unnamed protein product [Owenia fusiformis]
MITMMIRTSQGLSRFVCSILLLSFSGILYILSSESNRGNAAEKEINCKRKKTFGKDLPLTALASFPGSGNTWARHLIQELTGIYTGSVYNDKLMAVDEFPGSLIYNSSVIAIKTHLPVLQTPSGTRYDKAILLLREPYDTFLAEFNRAKGGKKTGHAKKEAFTKWDKFVTKSITEWSFFVDTWLNFKPMLYVLKYELLKSNLKEELRKVAEFLDVDVSTHSLNCVVQNAEGNYKRPKNKDDFNPLDMLTENTLTTLRSIKYRIYSRISDTGLNDH